MTIQTIIDSNSEAILLTDATEIVCTGDLYVNCFDCDFDSKVVINRLLSDGEYHQIATIGAFPDFLILPLGQYKFLKGETSALSVTIDGDYEIAGYEYSLDFSGVLNSQYFAFWW